jgi:hypothetical protein
MPWNIRYLTASFNKHVQLDLLMGFSAFLAPSKQASYAAERNNVLSRRSRYPYSIRVMVFCSENTLREFGTEWAALSVLPHRPHDLDSAVSELQTL